MKALQLALDLWSVRDQDDDRWYDTTLDDNWHDLADHQQGHLVLPYDTAACGNKGDILPAWVCCRCGSAETSRFTLENNHACNMAVPHCPRPGTWAYRRFPLVEAS